MELNKVKGYLLPKKFEEYAEKYENFNVYPDDIWLMGFPKTGTTWAQEMIWCIMNNNDFEKSKTTPIRKRFPVFELNAIDYGNVANGEPWEIDALDHCEHLERPRLIKTHLAWPLIPKKLRTGEVKPKMFYIHRNCLDTCISACTFSKAMGIYNFSSEQFGHLFLESKLLYTPFLQHVNEFLQRRNLPNLMVISYDELKSDLIGVIRNTAKYLERDFSEEQVQKLAKHLSFDSMKTNKSVSVRVVNGVEVPLTRKGVSGDYKNHLSQELIDKFQNEIEKNKSNENDIKGYDV